MMASHEARPRHLVRVLSLWLALVAAAHLAQAAPSEDLATNVLRVGKDDTADYASIQAAIDAAPDGATIRVGPGTYEEHLRIRTPLVLEGAGWNETTIALIFSHARCGIYASGKTAATIRQNVFWKNSSDRPDTKLHFRRSRDKGKETLEERP